MGPALPQEMLMAMALDDLFVGSSLGFDPHFLLQQSDGKFIQKKLVVDQMMPANLRSSALYFSMQMATATWIFILPVAAMNLRPDSKDYQDRFFINDGKGNFAYDAEHCQRYDQQELCKGS